jgi:hypothetical protein
VPDGFVPDPGDPDTYKYWTTEDLNAPRPAAETLLPADMVTHYRDVLGVHFYPQKQGTQAGWTYIPGAGPVYATDLPAYFENRYGETMPPKGACPIATGVFRMSGIWVWWIGLSPPPSGSSAAKASFQSIPVTPVCNNAQVADLFPEYAEPVEPESVVEFESTPEYVAAKEAEAAAAAVREAEAAGQFAPGALVLIDGEYREMQDDETWKVLGLSPVTIQGVELPTETVTTASGTQVTVGTTTWEQALEIAREIGRTNATDPPAVITPPAPPPGVEVLEAGPGSGLVGILAVLGIVGAVVAARRKPRRPRGYRRY